MADCETCTAGCYFIEKAYNAEKAGFKGILIYDNTFERLLTMAAPEDRPEIAKLADDISIPTALLTQVHNTRILHSMLSLNSMYWLCPKTTPALFAVLTIQCSSC